MIKTLLVIIRYTNLQCNRITSLFVNNRHCCHRYVMNKKLYYRDEQGVSVVLSWCTL